jgi:O-antigen ligase
LRGWSANPNQLALLCTVLGLLSLHLADRATAFRQKTAAMACGVLPIYVGRLTKSDTFALVLFASGLIFVMLKFRTWLFVDRRFSLRSALAWIVVPLLPMVLLATVPISYVVKQEAADVARQISKDNGEGTEEEALLRFEAWRQAIDRGIESGMLGLGPGPHVPIPPALVAARRTEVEPKFVEHPEVNGTANFEAHNTLLDLLTQCGLIGILSLLWLVATTVSGTYGARLDGLTTLLCGLALFGVTHLIIRHPIFWFALALCLVAPGGLQSAAVAYRRAYDAPVRS